MKRLPPLFYWLTLAALADWLIMRTITRSAIFMPKTGVMITVFGTLSVVGQFVATLDSLLAVWAAGWIIWQSIQAGSNTVFVWFGTLVLSFTFLFIAPSGWLLVSYHILLLGVIGITVRQLWKMDQPVEKRLIGLLPALALLFSGLYQITPAVYEAMGWPGPPPFTGILYNLGELVVVICPVVWWWVYGRRAPWKIWAGAGLLAGAFAGMLLANLSMTATIAIWSTGLSLYLPWPVYVVSFWLAAVTIIALKGHRDTTGWLLLLLVASGYAQQLSTQLLLGLIALWLLGNRETALGKWRQPVEPARCVPAG